MTLFARISVDPNVCFRKAVAFAGTRIWVSLILENLADGVSEADLLNAYPQLKPEDIRAALAYAADAIRGRALWPLETSGAMKIQVGRESLNPASPRGSRKSGMMWLTVVGQNLSGHSDTENLRSLSGRGSHADHLGI